ncbi:MAG: D-alanyl-D-alanine carboxypeptidase family protein [Acutalibacteraceae bacterium]
MKKLISLLLSFALVLSVACPFWSIGVIEADAAFDISFETTTKSLYLLNLDTNIVVYSKAANEKRYPASTTKIMTYIIVAEQVDDFENTRIKVDGSILHMLDGTGSSMAGIKADETLSIYQLLCCLMIHSGNDAALILADYIGGGDISKFVDMMNAKAKELGCKNTNFANPHGLHNENHYTTAEDMAIITQYALTLPQFSEITNTVVSDCLGDDRYLVTTNSMIDANRGGSYYYSYARGVKTGSTGTDSGYCLVSTAVRNGYTYLCVALGAPYEDKKGEQLENGAMIDSKALYQWAFANLEIKTILETSNLIKSIKLEYAWNKDTLQLVPAENYSTILPSDINISSIDKTYNLPKSVEAPVQAGDKIGTVTLSYANQKLVTIDLLAGETVERSELLTALDGINNILKSQWFFLTIAALVLIFIIYLIVATVYNRAKKNKRPVKTYRKL